MRVGAAVSNVSETIKVHPLEINVYGSGFRTSVGIQDSAAGDTAFVSIVYITPKQARKLAKALRASAKLREKK